MNGRRAVETVAVANGDIEACLTALREHPDVDASTVLHRGADEGVAQIRTTDPPLLSASDRSDSPLVYPLEVRRGEVVVDVISTYDSISKLGSRLERSDVTFDVVYVQRNHEICPVLTERQREVVLAAVEHGYYETPRQCTLTELADRIGVAKSTCSGMLHRAEGALVDNFLERGSATRNNARLPEPVRRELEG